MERIFMIKFVQLKMELIKIALTLDRMTLASGFKTSTCIPIPGEDGTKPPLRGSNSSTL